MVTGNLHKKICAARSSGSRDMLVDRQTDRQTDRSTPLSYWAGVIMINRCYCFDAVIV